MGPDCSKPARRRVDDDDYDEVRVIKHRRPPRDNSLALRIIGAVAGIGAILAACVIAGIVAYVLVNTPPFLGEWESTTMKRPVRAQQGMDDQIPEVLLFLEKAPDGQLGTYTDENDQEFFFRWQDHDKKAKTVVFVMENPNDTFWRGIRSPATFTYSIAGNRMTLTGGGHTLTFKKFLD